MGWWPCKCVPVEECRIITTSLCDEEVSIYRITTNWTNDNCSSCALWSGDFDLKWIGDDTWESAMSTSTACNHTEGDPLWRLQISGGYYTLTAVGLGYEWTKSTASWTCASVNVLSAEVAITPNPCAGVLDEISVVPCLFTCTLCEGEIPDTVSVTISEILNGWTCNCSGFNTTFILSANGPCNWTYVGTMPCAYGLVIHYGVTAFISTGLGGDAKLTISLQGELIKDEAVSVATFGRVWTHVYDSPAIDCTETVVLTNPNGEGYVCFGDGVAQFN